LIHSGATEEVDDFEDLPRGDGVLIISPQGNVLSSNLQVERILRMKLSRGQVVRVEDIFDRQYRPLASLAIREAVQAGHSRSDLKATIRTGSGAPVPMIYSVSPLYDEQDRIIGVVLTFKDTPPGNGVPGTAGHDAELHYDTLFENLAEGVFTINTRWRITSFNQRAQEVTGFKREEVLGRYCWEIFKSDLCETGCPLRSTLETGMIRMDQDVRIIGRHGHRHSILVNTSVLKDKNDKVIGAVETFRPLTPVQAEDELEEPKEQRVNVIGQSPALNRVMRMLPDVAASDASVILEGESGTGKELFAHAIHSLSPRADGPFVAVNCSALVETLLESELFGHEKGAFTGAINNKVGRFELARGGTLFLDEIADIKKDIQVKLLRVLEERTFERVGGTRPIPMEARVIAATNRNLIEEVRVGRFREDLFYRLHTVPLYLPPLRERPEDIPLLVNHLIAEYNTKYEKKVRGLDPKVMTVFQRYHWPGNVRELQRVLEYAYVFVKGLVITQTHLPELEEPPQSACYDRTSNRPDLWEDERQTIITALEKSSGRRQEAARLLGISRSSLWRKMKAYSLL